MCKLREIICKYIPETEMFDIIEFFKDNEIGNLYYKSESKFNITIKNQLKHQSNNNLIEKSISGGNNSDEYNLDLKINKKKYQVQIEEYYDKEIIDTNSKTQFIKNDKYKKINLDNIKINEDKNRKIINFIKFGAKKNSFNEFNENEHCGILIIDLKKKISTIQSINNYTNCVKCLSTGKNIFKIGDILTQIMIIISIKNKLNKIHLTDNSYLLCSNSVKIPLIYLRTITQGKPFYSKYGFVPKYKQDFEAYKDNILNYNKHKTITKEQFIKYFNYRKFDINIDKHKKILNYINNTLIPRLKETNLVSYIIKSIYDDENIEGCSILNNILMKIYDELEYIRYDDKNFILDLKNNCPFLF